MQDLRDRILKNWHVAKAPKKRERIKEALDRFIEAIEPERESGNMADSRTMTNNQRLN